MIIAEFNPWQGLLGGGLIGLAAVLLMLGIGRIAGISGIFAATLKLSSSLPWQWAFIAGLLISGAGIHFFIQPVEIEISAQWPLLIIAGLLVGFGTRLGSGCTSGHGVCGLSRFSLRSLVATGTFMATAVATVFVISQIISS